MTLHLDAFGEILLSLALILFVAKATHNTRTIETRNPALFSRYRLPILRFSLAVLIIHWCFLVVHTLAIPIDAFDAVNSSVGPLVLASLVIVCGINYAGLLRQYNNSPSVPKNALIQEQLLLQNVSQTQRNLSLQRKVKDARRLNLKSQMNPHFLFNVLTGIQHLLMRNESEKASLVFSKFRKLLLMGFLSHDQVIGSLRQEMEHIDHYLGLEDTRLEKKIAVRWKIESDVHPDHTPFPLFILQPLVENAIWHGLSSQTVLNPELHIKVAWLDEGLEIHVQDNGIGIQNSSNKSGSTRHRSRGTAIVHERLSLLHHPGTFKMMERPPSHPFESGVTALIRLPLWRLEPKWNELEKRKAG